MQMAAKFYDITPKISSRLAVFPGDQAFERRISMDFKNGDHLGLSSILTTVHLGAHADAPSHYHATGVGIDGRHVGRYLGAAQVVHARGLKAKECIGRRHVQAPIKSPRVLFYTGSFPDPEKWEDDFNSFEPNFLSELADQGVRLVGIDTPSVDPADSKALEAHQILFARDIAVLEGLWLEGVPEGHYILVAPPLPIENGDASPVRALLLPMLSDFPELER